MKQHKYQILAGAVVVGLLLLGMLLYSPLADPARFWQCSPAEPRGDDLEAWQKTIAPEQTSVEPDEDFFDNFTISSDSDFFTVQHTHGNPPDNPFDFELYEMTPGETFNIGGGNVKFSCIGAAYHDANQTMADDVAFRLFDPNLQPVADTDLSEFGNCVITETGSNFRYNPWPAVQFVFNYRQTEDLMFHGIKIFDGRTHNLLTSGYSSSASHGSIRFNTHLPIWHRTPIDIVFDVSYGPVKTFEFAPLPGEGFDEGSFQCRLLGVFETVEPGRHSTSSRDNITTHQFPKASPEEKTGLTLFFACRPTASNMPVTFEFLDKDGDKISTRGSSTSGHALSIAFKSPLKEIALIRAHYRSRRYRIVMNLPYIPGLPEENNAISNLFDVYIPYVRLRDPGQVERCVRGTLQLGRSTTIGTVPAAGINSFAFPMDFNDVTLRDIARAYARGGSLSVDIENDRLRRQYPVPLWQRFKQFLQKLFP